MMTNQQLPYGAPMPPPTPPLEPNYTPINHVLHLILTVFTCGVWSIVWIAISIIKSGEEQRLRSQYANALRAYQRAYWLWTHQEQDRNL